MTEIQIVHGLFTEFRHERGDEIRVRQALIYPSSVFSRGITKTHPRTHWEHFVIYNRAERDLRLGLPLVRLWYNEFVNQYTSSGYTQTGTPFLVETTLEEYETAVLKGEFPRNVALRIKRVKDATKIPDVFELRAA